MLGTTPSPLSESPITGIGHVQAESPVRINGRYDRMPIDRHGIVGLQTLQTWRAQPLAEWPAMVQTNLTGVFPGCQASVVPKRSPGASSLWPPLGRISSPAKRWT